jgi:carboxyl-terminal processing protease
MFRHSLAFPTILAIAIIGAASIAAQKRKPDKTIGRGVVATVTGTANVPSLPPDVERRFNTFMMVWTTIRDNYFDKTYSNLNWNAIRTEFDPKVKAAKSDAELHNLLNAMLGRLNKSHLGVIPPEVYKTLNDVTDRVKANERAGEVGSSDLLRMQDDGRGDGPDTTDGDAEYGIGVELSLVSDRFMITRMDQNSTAEYAGLKRGYVIDKVNGVSLQEMLDRILVYNASMHSTSVKQFVPAYVVSAMLNGDRDTYVTLGYLDENDQPKESRVRREILKEKSIAVAPNFPAQQLSFESRSIDENTGYIRFNMFAIPVIERFCRAVGEFKAKSGLVIDLRGNTGGVMASVPTLAGMLTSDSLDLGTSIYRNHTEPLQAPAKAKNYKGRVVLIVDDRTASAAEMFALSLREDGRALIVGQHTSGEALPSIMLNLPTGARLLYPFANYRSPGGTYIEGNGIEPDKVIQIDRRSLLAGTDLQLDAAVNLLADKTAFAELKPKTSASNQKAGAGVDSEPPRPAAKVTQPAAVSARIQKPPAVVSAMVTPSTRNLPIGQDAASKKYVDEFLNAIGGVEAIRAINTIAATGSATLRSFGTTSQFRFRTYRDAGPKFSAILESDATGEIREVMNGPSHWVQTDFGLDEDLSKIPGMENSDIMTAITELADYSAAYPSLSFTGTFDREGRKTAVLEGKTRSGRAVALAFDVETRLLVNVTKGYSSVSYRDYRSVGNVKLPFSVDKTGVINVALSQITINKPVENAFFEKKQNCYDKVD